MSTRHEHGPIIPDRLPGEQELSRLYQQTPDEQPPAALDAAIVAEARRAARPRLRLLKGGKSLGQLSRRWAIPMSLAAALLVTIGVARYLQDDIGKPLMRSQAHEASLVEADASAQPDEEVAERQERSKPMLEEADVPKNESVRSALQAQASQPAERAAASQAVLSEPLASSSEYRQDILPMPTAPAPMMKRAVKPEQAKEKPPAKQELRPGLRQRRSTQDDQLIAGKERDTRTPGRGRLTTEEAHMPPQIQMMDTLEIQRADLAAEPADRSPQEWLEEISELFRVGKHEEAEDRLQAFQKRYPDYTDYPESFPEAVLARLREQSLSEKPVDRE